MTAEGRLGCRLGLLSPMTGGVNKLSVIIGWFSPVASVRPVSVQTGRLIAGPLISILIIPVGFMLRFVPTLKLWLPQATKN